MQKHQEADMRVPVYVPLIAVAAVIAGGIYAETAYQRHHAERTADDSSFTATKVATATTPAKPAHKVVRTGTPVNPRSKMASIQPRTSSKLATGQLVKLTGVVDSATPTALVVERNGKPVTVRLNGASEPYLQVGSDVDRTTVGKTVTVYGRIRDASTTKPVVDADAVYAPQSRRLLFSNGQNQTMSGDVAAQTRVRFTASYQTM
jgi:hypothetical protein